jgi:hypothetical protein
LGAVQIKDIRRQVKAAESEGREWRIESRVSWQTLYMRQCTAVAHNITLEQVTQNPVSRELQSAFARHTTGEEQAVPKGSPSHSPRSIVRDIAIEVEENES